MSIDPADEIREKLDDTTRRQREASDPQFSVWVSANAGTGKTHVLTSRTLRLLLAGTLPERILCLTYTKAAAAEMSTRVFNRLAGWVTESDEKLKKELTNLLGREPSNEETFRARTLFTRAIETPGGLKVQTIHAFCERLLQRFPMEAGVPPGFATLDDDLGRSLKREAIDLTISEALADPESQLGEALMRAVAFAAEERFEDVLTQAIADRRWLAGIAQAARDASGNDRWLAEQEELLREVLGVPHGLALAGLADDMAAVLGNGIIETASRVLAQSKAKTDLRLAELLAQAKAAGSPRKKIEHLKTALLTGDGDPRKTLGTKAIQEAEPALCQNLADASIRLAELVRSEVALKCVQASLVLVTLAARVYQHFNDAKERRAALDFDDLIEKAVGLLSSDHLDATDWVLYKLDGGIDHILVDESQDTSPAQWSIVRSLATEFFSGEGAHENQRTLFAVGDEKQSIYSFQGAAPEMFAAMGEAFGKMAEASGQKLRQIPLDLSFRTVAPILESVDRVFADALRTPGLSGSGRAIEHAVKRVGEAGLVEIWPVEKPEQQEETDAFEPLGEETVQPPVERLAARIADTISGWIESGEMLEAKGRPIRPGDVLILCRKRRPFAAPMVAALKARNIPVAGADRLVLTQQLAVQDLIALGDFATLPDDDLTLAAILKSPIIGLDEEQLFELAYKRKGSLWKALIDKRNDKPQFTEAAKRLVELRQRADFLPPFEFYAKVLDEDGLRRRLLARLGHEAADPIDEFLNLAIAYDEREAPSLTGFLSWLRETDREIKRDMEQGVNEVRVMTVHASKGLEAPIVFLPDTCTTASAGGASDPLTRLDDAKPGPDGEPARTWTIKGAGKKITAIKDARDAKKLKEQQELNRLLYVAMTRAEDRLYVAGFEGGRPRPPDCWYDIVRQGLEDSIQAVTGPDGREVLRLQGEQSVARADARSHAAAAGAPLQPPQWARSKAPRIPLVMLPLAPSRLVPYEADSEGEPVPGPTRPESRGAPDEPSAPAPEEAAGDRDRFLRGTLTHALFEHLPAVREDRRGAAAKAFLEARGSALPAHVRRAIVEEVENVLGDPVFAALFGPRSRAEVAVAARLQRPGGKGPPLSLSGSIDRLAEVDGSYLIVDFKTNRDVPSGPETIAEAYLLQLAAYRLALKAIEPGRRVRAGLLWTRVARLIEVPDARLDEAERQLWELSSSQS
ncbi:MAG: double-strand break repair helicase AddA [Alphaproteobacteria bacterium]|nr:double-strand break repair helicase AddA [Alphaproteobacteria bacterium]